jgi:hypothetical protein
MFYFVKVTLKYQCDMIVVWFVGVSAMSYMTTISCTTGPGIETLGNYRTWYPTKYRVLERRISFIHFISVWTIYYLIHKNISFRFIGSNSRSGKSNFSLSVGSQRVRLLPQLQIFLSLQDISLGQPGANVYQIEFIFAFHRTNRLTVMIADQVWPHRHRISSLSRLIINYSFFKVFWESFGIFKMMIWNFRAINGLPNLDLVGNQSTLQNRNILNHALLIQFMNCHVIQDVKEPAFDQRRMSSIQNWESESIILEQSEKWCFSLMGVNIFRYVSLQIGMNIDE